jgi:hypothetical protein
MEVCLKQRKAFFASVNPGVQAPVPPRKGKLIQIDQRCKCKTKNFETIRGIQSRSISRHWCNQ